MAAERRKNWIGEHPKRSRWPLPHACAACLRRLLAPPLTSELGTNAANAALPAPPLPPCLRRLLAPPARANAALPAPPACAACASKCSSAGAACLRRQCFAGALLASARLLLTCARLCSACLCRLTCAHLCSACLCRLTCAHLRLPCQAGSQICCVSPSAICFEEFQQVDESWCRKGDDFDHRLEDSPVALPVVGRGSSHRGLSTQACFSLCLYRQTNCRQKRKKQQIGFRADSAQRQQIR